MWTTFQTRRLNPPAGNCVWIALLLGVVLADAGCRRSEPEESGQLPVDTTTLDQMRPGEMSPPPAPPGADADDDSDAPRSLPKSHELPGWVKTRPIRVFSPSEMRQAIADDGLAGSLQSYRLARLATCEYEAARVKAQVLLIEAVTPTDAFGVFSLLTRRGGQKIRPEDRSIRAIEVGIDTWKILAWHGSSCLQLSFPARADAEINLVTQLCNRIVFSIPAADPPLLLAALPRERIDDAKVWVVRTTAALRRIPDATLAQVVTAGLDSRLQLGDNGFLWIASIESPAGVLSRERPATDAPTEKESPPDLPPLSLEESPNLIFLAEYPDESAAAAAHQRYAEALTTPAADLDRNTTLLPAQGRYLIGSWTADAEARLPILPGLVKTLTGSALPPPATNPPAVAAPAHP